MKQFAFSLAALAASAACASVCPSFGGRVKLTELKVALSPTAASPTWSAQGANGGLSVDRDGVARYTFNVKGAPTIDGSFRGEAAGTDGARLVWTFAPRADAFLPMLGVCASYPYADFKGGWVEADGKRFDFPTGKAMGVFNGTLKRLVLKRPAGQDLAFEFAAPTQVYVQNNRVWDNENFSVRLLVPRDGKRGYVGGAKTTIDVTVRGAGAWDSTKPLQPVVLKASADWIPFAANPWIKAGSALDFSSIRRTEAPAGKYGRVVGRGENFEFEKLPGVRQRFYGINVCGDANTVTLESARKFAANLARLGYNAIRFHHHETTIIAGMDDPTRCTPNPKALDGFDALVAACVENGIYMTTDLFVSRHNAGIKWRTIGIDRDGELGMTDFKRLVLVNEKLFQNYLAFTRNFFGHRNRYTGRTFAEEPAVVGVSLVNEGNIDAVGGELLLREKDWRDAYATWLAAKRKADPATWRNVTEKIPNDYKSSRWASAVLLFLKETEERFAARVQAFLRDELGMKALVTDMNDAGGNTAAFQVVREKTYGYVDTHFYVDHPRFLGTPWQRPSWCPNANPILGLAMGAQSIASVRSFNRPFTITEYNFSGPGRFRGVGGIACGAQGALQNWAGLWRFAWSHGRQGVEAPEKKSMGYFDISGDPLSLAAERASICLFLRGDLEPLKRTYEATIPLSAMNAPSDKIGLSARTTWAWASWYAKVGTCVGETARAGSAGLFDTAFEKSGDQVRAELLPGATAENMPVAGDGHLRVNGTTGVFLLDTPRTSGGFAEGGEIDCGALKADLGKTAATLWASSLSDAPISAADRILVTYLTDVQNTGIRYADSDLTVLLEFGRLPHLMRNGEAKVSLAVAPGNWHVWALETDGSRRAEVPCRIADGRLAFTADIDREPNAATFLYELTR